MLLSDSLCLALPVRPLKKSSSSVWRRVNFHLSSSPPFPPLCHPTPPLLPPPAHLVPAGLRGTTCDPGPLPVTWGHRGPVLSPQQPLVTSSKPGPAAYQQSVLPITGHRSRNSDVSGNTADSAGRRSHFDGGLRSVSVINHQNWQERRRC